MFLVLVLALLLVSPVPGVEEEDEEAMAGRFPRRWKWVAWRRLRYRSRVLGVDCVIESADDVFMVDTGN